MSAPRWGTAPAARAAVVLAVAVLAALALTTRAEAQSDDPKQAYGEARSKFQSGEYEAALAAIAAGLASDPQNRRLLFLRGTVLLERRDYEAALVAFQAFLDAKPRGANKRKARRIVANLRVVRTTFLEIEVANGPARIYFDSRSYGVICEAAPVCKKGVVPGRYRVYIERDGFESVRTRVAVRAGRTARLEQTLVEKPSSAVIDVTPEDSEVSIDGTAVGRGAQTVELAAGEHTVRVERPGFAPHEETLTARRGKPLQLAVRLRERIPITLSAPEAELTLDGEPIAIEDGAITLPPGSDARTLIARAEGYEDAAVEIPAERPDDYTIELTLVEETPEPPPVEPEVVEPPEWSSGQIAAVATSGTLALAGYGTAAILAISADSKWGDAEELCVADSGDGVLCNAAGLAAGNDARSAASQANFGLAVGTIAAVGMLWSINW
ncbi:MAG: PEGA domain-containing protein, partial [Myxococcota bacterium]